MRNVLILAMSTALTGCPAETQTATCSGAVINGRCAENVCGSAGVRSDGYCNDDPNAPQDPPKLVRSETVATEKAIDGFDIEAVPAGAAGWKIHIVSKVDAVSSVVWDESTFVGSEGRSYGRLVVGETKRMDTAKAHPNLPVAPHADVVQFVVVENLVDQERLEADVIEKYGRMDSYRIKKLEELRAVREKAIVGGKLYVTVSGPSGKQTWAGVVRPPAGGE